MADFSKTICPFMLFAEHAFCWERRWRCTRLACSSLNFLKQRVGCKLAGIGSQRETYRQRQVREDGGHFEQSSYYQVYALDMFLFDAVLRERDAAENWNVWPEYFSTRCWGRAGPCLSSATTMVADFFIHLASEIVAGALR